MSNMEWDRIHCIPWQEGMSQLSDGEVDLIITSPPYNLGKQFHTGSKRWESYSLYDDAMPEDEYQEGQKDFLCSCFRVLSENGSMFYNHKPRIKDGITIHPLQWILDTPFVLKQEIVWRNRSQNFDKIRFYPHTERVYWLTKSPKTKLFNAVGMCDIWDEFKNQRRDPVHKATFPVELPEAIIKCFPDARKILDPYMGIGTTARAVKRCNSSDGGRRMFLGFEIDSVYIERAEELLVSV